MDQKTKIRTLIKEKKSFYNSAELETLSIPPLFGLETSPEFENAKKIAIYWSLPDEVNTHGFIEKWWQKKDLFLPIIQDNDLCFVPYTGLANLHEGAYGVFEPNDQSLIDPDLLDLIVVPGVAFDEEGNRLGRGKGYYDRYLSKTKAHKLALAFPFQMFENIPTEAHDAKLDQVIF